MNRCFIVLFIILFISLTSCSPSESYIATVIAETELASPSDTPAPTNTLMPTETNTQVPSPTFTLTPPPYTRCLSLEFYETILSGRIEKDINFYPTVSTDDSLWNYEYSWTDNGDIFSYYAQVEDNCVIEGVAQFIVNINSDNAGFAGLFISAIEEALSPQSDGDNWFLAVWEKGCTVPRTELYGTETIVNDGTYWGFSCQIDGLTDLFMLMLLINVEGESH